MKREDENMDLEKNAPYLTKINKQNPFATPDRYFNRLSEEVLNQISLPNDLVVEDYFKVSTNYFENLNQQIHSAIYLEEFSINDKNYGGFDVPGNYFDQSQDKIEQKTSRSTKKHNIVRLNFIRYAAAACVLLTTSLGIYFDIQRTTSVDYQLSKIPATELESYLNQHTDGSDVPMLIENIDDNTSLSIDDFTLENTN